MKPIIANPRREKFLTTVFMAAGHKMLPLLKGVFDAGKAPEFQAADLEYRDPDTGLSMVLRLAAQLMTKEQAAFLDKHGVMPPAPEKPAGGEPSQAETGGSYSPPPIESDPMLANLGDCQSPPARTLREPGSTLLPGAGG